MVCYEIFTRKNIFITPKEAYQFDVNEREIAALRKITEKSNVLIRLSGNGNYANVDKEQVENFKKNIISSVFVYDTLHKALNGHIPPEN